MKFGYTIIYVPDVAASLAFFTKAKHSFDEIAAVGGIDPGCAQNNCRRFAVEDAQFTLIF